jgi:tol-pal system protein YbgF
MNSISLPPTFFGRQLVIVSLVLGFGGSAGAGIFEDEEARKAILDLRQKVESLKADSEQKLSDQIRRSADEVAQLRRSMVELQNQLEVTRGDAAKLQGQGEQLARDLAETQRRQKDSNQMFDERLRKFEPTRVNLDGQEFMAEMVERRDFEAALAVFRKGEFASAQLIFVDFLNRHPNTGYRASTLFWLGNAQYATKDYKDAVVSFRALVSLAPSHIRIPDTLLSIANSQLEMKEVKAARKTLEDLVANHPGTEAATAARDRLARFK